MITKFSVTPNTSFRPAFSYDHVMTLNEGISSDAHKLFILRQVRTWTEIAESYQQQGDLVNTKRAFEITAAYRELAIKQYEVAA